ncbi:MAG: hypothetical protein HYX63_19300 [Gammaproteobacteria bacterium]|nr:hypothetical protein [Gammaproteobacteria bacterium]
MITIQVSFADLLDRISILEIKSERIIDASKLANIQVELRALNSSWCAAPVPHNDDALLTRVARLKSINEELWEIEDAIRAKERAKQFDAEFIELARQVYLTNDRRATVKREIDLQLGATFREEKSYQSY